MTRVGFEPTPPKRVQLECTALDRSAIAPNRYYWVIEFFFVYNRFVTLEMKFLLHIESA